MFVLAAIAPLLNTAVALGVQHVGLGLIDLSALGLGGLGGSLVALMVSTFIIDFFYYWFHRALHANAYLWQTHLLHHSDEHMNVMTAQRGHIAEGMLAPLFITLPMAVLFKLPAITIGVLSLVPYMYLFVAHANIKLGFGPLWWVLISPNYHRIHHSIEARHWDKNFANWFPVWDVIFGTLYRPAKDEYPATGVDGVAVKSLGEAFAQPFVGWFRLASRRPTSAGQTAIGDSPT
jgi:sterol desaturase/sphingolipid hydroxylase (fatty acid hydroxylase superfamily)